MMDTELRTRMMAALNKVAKWRMVFASWQLGTRDRADPECQAVKEHRECTILTRIDANALANLLLAKGVFTVEELQEATIVEAEAQDAAYELFFPGFKTNEMGVDINLSVASKTMAGWRP